METDWVWSRLEPIERRVADLLLQGKSNSAICTEMYLSRTRVQEYVKRLVIKAGASSTRETLVLLAQEKETLSLLHILDAAQECIVILQDRVLRFANKAAADLLGYTVEELDGIPMVELIAPAVKGEQMRRYGLRMSGESIPISYTTKTITRTGETRDMTIASAGLVRYRGRPAILVIASPCEPEST